jgi:starch phosphorylase
VETFRSNLPERLDLPAPIARLSELAYNLWWTWQPEAVRLFGRIDYALWERLGHNPIRLLREVARERLSTAANNPDYLNLYVQVLADFDAALAAEVGWAPKTHPELTNHPIAYFSMEYGLHETVPVYSGGLGILAGDHLKESSDLGLPLVGVGFLYTQGYFTQRLSEDGWQEELNHHIRLEDLPILPVFSRDGGRLAVEVEFPDRAVALQVWEVRVGRVPLYLLDSNLESNSEADRLLTARLYWADLDRRVLQQVLLGVGGVRVLRALGYNPSVWHMNEGHAAFLTLERARELVAASRTYTEAMDQTRTQNTFTTHTPVPAGNDEFPLWLIDKYLANFWPQLRMSRDQFIDIARRQQPWGESFSMGVLALRNSGSRNAVSELHGQVARRMWHFLWPERQEHQVPIVHVTNGVHTANWIARRLGKLFALYLGPDWYSQVDDESLWAGLDAIPNTELWEVRLHLKRKLAFYLRERVRDRWTAGGFHPVQVVSSGVLVNPYALTIGFGRRFATYKRASLVLTDVDRLLELINRPNAPVQVLFAGKAHPADEDGKQLVQKIYRQVKRAEAGGRIVFLEDYDMNLARYLVQGVDVWLNTPRRPMEASGTSGMKAAINGVLNLSVLDGWWREAYDGRNGWAIGEDRQLESNEAQDAADAESLYATLENEIIPLYYRRDPKEVSHEWIARMKASMKAVIPRFSTRRMLKEYVERLYLPATNNQAAHPASAPPHA